MPLSLSYDRIAQPGGPGVREASLSGTRGWGCRARSLLIAFGLAGAVLVACIRLQSQRGKAQPVLHQDVLKRYQATGGGGAECAADGQNCTATKCCTAPGSRCYAKSKSWATCLSTCKPGMQDPFDKAKQPWSCQPLGPRTPPCAKPAENCKVSRCCSGPSMQCYQKNEYWASCRPNCQPGAIDPTDPIKEPWSCKELGRRSPPCAELGENCVKSKCCAEIGTQCYEKNVFYGTCKAKCEKGVIDVDSVWSCRELGPRTPTCSWSGEDCSWTRTCCEWGKHCYRLSATKAECRDRCKVGDGVCQELGGAASMRPALLPAAPGAAAAGTSLFCFTVVTPGTYERGLVEMIRAKRAGIFTCDESAVLTGGKAKFVKQGDWKSVVNIDVFIKVWEDVQAGSQYLQHDYTVKVDPDAVFFPDRLRQHLAKLNVPAGASVYFKNSPWSSTNRWQFGFLGPLEVFSKEALRQYFELQRTCSDHLSHFGGEDLYMKECMDVIGARFMTDTNLLSNINNAPGCSDGTKVVFHAYKNVEDWTACFDTARAPGPKTVV